MSLHLRQRKRQILPFPRLWNESLCEIRLDVRIIKGRQSSGGILPPKIVHSNTRETLRYPYVVQAPVRRKSSLSDTLFVHSFRRSREECEERRKQRNDWPKILVGLQQAIVCDCTMYVYVSLGKRWTMTLRVLSWIYETEAEKWSDNR